MAYQIIFFDLDGTLIDPKENITKSAQHALAQFGIHEKLDKLIPFIGPPLNDSFKKYYDFNEEHSKQAAEYYREYFLKNGTKEVVL